MKNGLCFEQLAVMNCHYARHSFRYFLDSAVKNGVSNVEIWAQPYYVEHAVPECVKKTKRMLQERGLKLVCYTPEALSSPHNIASADADMRAHSIAFLERGIEIAAELESSKMLLISGWGNLDEPREEAMQRCVESIGTVCKKAEREGVTLALEHLSPISSNLVNTAADIWAVLDQVKSPALKGMLDTCQVGLVQESVEDYLRLLGEDLVHVHLVDGTPGGHLAFGDGTLPLQQIVQTLGQAGYGGNISMEIADRRYFAHPEQADERSIRAFRSWIEK